MVEKTDYGLKIKFSDKMTLEQMQGISKQVDPILIDCKNKGKKICFFIDLSEVKIQDQEIMQEMGKGMDLAKDVVERVSIVFSSNIAKLQISNKSREKGLNEHQRFFAVTDENYMEKALDWIRNGK